LHFGTGLITTPADSSVTNAKLTSSVISSQSLVTADSSNDHVLIHDATDSALKKALYPSGFDVSSITGATALAVQPASDDEIVFSDAGTLKRLDIKHIQNTPAFHAYNPQNGNMATNTQETLEFDTELFDSDGCYDTGTYRFTPAVQGKYFIYWAVRWNTTTNAATRLDTTVKFNNSSDVLNARNDNGDYSTVNGSGILNMDTDDYIELLGFQNTAYTQAVTSEAAYSYFGAFRISGVS